MNGIFNEVARRKAARQAWMAALTWYQNETDEFSQDRLKRANEAFEAWWGKRK